MKLGRMKKTAEEAAKSGAPASAHGAWWLQVNKLIHEIFEGLCFGTMPTRERGLVQEEV